MTRRLSVVRDGHQEESWALEVEAGPYGSEKAQRAFVLSTDPERLPRLLTRYLTTNLPAPGDRLARETEGQPLPAWPARKERKEALVGVLAGGVEGVAGTVGDAVALLESVWRSAPAEGAKSAA
jgi:hypothetical protein